MPRLLDERFLSVHPRTLLWWEQREKCLSCKHVRRPPGGLMHQEHGGSGLMQCAAASRKGSRRPESCIEAREQACGPEAALFEPM